MEPSELVTTYIRTVKSTEQSLTIHYKNVVSLGTLVPNSRDQHEKMTTKFYTPQNTPQNTLCLRKADWTALLTVLITSHCYKQIKNPNSLTSRRFQDFKIQPYFVCQSICLPAVRSTSARHRGPVSSHKIGDCCLNTKPLYQRTLIYSVIACLLVIHYIHWSSCLEQKYQNLTYHKHSMEGVNM